MIWIYAVGERPELPLPGITGLSGAPLEGVAEGPLLAIVSRHSQPPFAPDADALWAHERVVEAMMDQRAVLPMRFGTHVADDEAAQAELRARREPLLSALERVRGRIELAVRALHSAPPHAGTGREHLRALLGDSHAASALHEPLAALAVAARRSPQRTPGELLRAAYLVEANEVPHFRRTVRLLQREHADVALLCTGPWPAYSFVDG